MSAAKAPSAGRSVSPANASAFQRPDPPQSEARAVTNFEWGNACKSLMQCSGQNQISGSREVLPCSKRPLDSLHTNGFTKSRNPPISLINQKAKTKPKEQHDSVT